MIRNLVNRILGRSRQELHQENTVSITAGGNITAGTVVGGNLHQHNYYFSSPPEPIPQPADSVAELGRFLDKNDVSSTEDHVVSTEVSLRIKEGEELQKRKRFSEALHIYLQVTSDPSVYGKAGPAALFSINLNIAICYLNLGDTEEYLTKAKKHLDQAKAVRAGHEEQLCLVFAWYHFEKKETDAAFEWAKKAIELKPDYIKAINIESIIRQERGVPLETILNERYFEDGKPRGLVLKDSSALFMLGQLLFRDNRFDEAIEYLSLSVEKGADEFLAMAFLGNVFLIKAFGGKDRVPDINLNKDIDLKYLTISASWFEKAFKLAGSVGLEGELKTFYVNASSAYFLLGKHREAYEEIQKAIGLGLREEGLLIHKGKIEVALGRIDEAKRTYSGLHGYSARIEEAIVSIIEDRNENAILILRDLLNDSVSLGPSEKTLCQELLAEAYLELRQFDAATEILNSLEQEGRASWESRVARAKLVEYSQDDVTGATQLYQQALNESSRHPRAVFDAVRFYGRTKQYDLIIGLLQGLVDENLPLVEVAKEDVYSYLAKAYHHKGSFLKAIEVVSEGLSKGVARPILRDILAESYFALRRYSEANQVFQEILADLPSDYQRNLDVAASLAMMGRVEESIPHFTRAERFHQGAPDSIFYMNYAKVKLLQGDNEEALKLAEKARDIDRDRPKSPAHAFYAHMGIRCGQVDSTIHYLAEYHSCYPKEPWIWRIQALEEENDGKKRLTPEFLKFLQAQSERFNRAIIAYKRSPLPIYYLARLFRRPLKEIWDWRYFYRLLIHIDSGHPDAMRQEFENLRTARTVMLDYLSLLVLNHIGLLEALIQEFDTVCVSQSLFDEIQADLIESEDTELRKIWEILRHSQRVQFVYSDTESYTDDERKLESVIGGPTRDTLLTARDKGHVLCCGDERFKQIAGGLKIRVTGIYAVLQRLCLAERLSDSDVSRAKLVLIEENHSFVSFNANDMIIMARSNGYRLDQKLACFFKPILEGDPEYVSFIKVYVAFIRHLLQTNLQIEVILPWLVQYAVVFQRLYGRDHIAEAFPQIFSTRKTFLSKDGLSITTKDFCLLSLALVCTLIHVLCEDPEKETALLATVSRSVTHHDLALRYHNDILPDARTRGEIVRRRIQGRVAEGEPIEDMIIRAA